MSERSVVAILRNGNYVALQRRDDVPTIPYAGMLQLFGGKVEKNETPDEAIGREVGEETSLEAETLDFRKLWEGEFVGQDAEGNPQKRHVTLYEVDVPTLDFEVYEGTGREVVGLDAVETHKHEMTNFAYLALTNQLGEQGAGA